MGDKPNHFYLKENPFQSVNFVDKSIQRWLKQNIKNSGLVKFNVIIYYTLLSQSTRPKNNEE